MRIIPLLTVLLTWASLVESLCAQTEAASPAEVRRADQAAVLAGISSVEYSGVASPIGLFGETAFPLLMMEDEGRPRVIAAAARLGRGRLVAFGHDSFISNPFPQADNEKLIGNLMLWAAGLNGETRQQLRVGVRDNRKLFDRLQSAGVPVVALNGPQLNGPQLNGPQLNGPQWTKTLASCNVVFTKLNKTSPAELMALERFVQRGGGVVSAFPGWVWPMYVAAPGQQLSNDFPAHTLFAPAGLIWLDATVSRKPATKPVIIARNQPDAGNASLAVDALEAALTQPKSKSTGESLTNLLPGLQEVMAGLPAEDEMIASRLLGLLDEEQDRFPVPSRQSPIRKQRQSFEYALVGIEAGLRASLPVDKVTAAPSAATFPGAVPAEAPRVDVTVPVETSIPGWHSTGLYAASGEKIHVATSVAAAKGGLSLRIGCHSDKLWHKDTLHRPPTIDRTFPINAARIDAASAYGGLIYVVVPKECRLGQVDVRIDGAVQAPLYVHGQTSVADWRFTIREHPAPWAELACGRVIVTVPSAYIRGLDFPDKVMEHWIAVLDGCADLAMIDHDRPRPERLVADVQISAGFMHSGYPIMLHQPEGKSLVDPLGFPQQGNWGFYHELGHNHQQRAWTFDGTGEVTCNLFSLYLFDTLHSGVDGHANVTAAKRLEIGTKFLSAGADFDQWKQQPFTALIMYHQLKSAFGWDPFKKVFAEYQSFPADEQPKTDDDRRDEWMVRMSRATGKNLGPFFEKWGVPTSAAARTSVRDLDAWMPKSF